MKIIHTNHLSEDAKKIRIEVFMNEQGFQNEFDEFDDMSIHFLAYDVEPVAVCRIYFDHLKNHYVLGRLAVIKNKRKQGYGAKIIEAAKQVINEKGGTSIHLHAQCQAMPFYQQLGFEAYGEMDYDEDCPHYWMKLTL